MTSRYFRVLTPLGWLALAAVVAVLLLVVGRGVGLRWDPLQLQARRLETAQRRADHAEAEVAVRTLEAAARSRQVESLDAFHRHTQAVERATASAEIRARTADDAETPLDPARAERLHDYDRELCRLASAVAGCTAPADPA